MTTPIVKKSIFSTILLIVFLVGCSEKTGNQEKPIEMKYCLSADSLIEYFVQNENQVNPIYLSYHNQKLHAKNKISEAKKIDSFTKTYIQNHPKKQIEFYCLIDKGYQCLSNPTKKDCDQIYRRINDLSDEINDSNFKVVCLTYNGSYFFFQNRIDTANRIFLQAYNLALATQNRPYIERLCNNLGSISMKMKQFRNARYYLSKALLMMKENKVSNPVLISNLATAYMSEGNYTQAKRTLEEGIKTNSSNHDYNNQLLEFNLAMAHQSLNEFEQSHEILKKYKNKVINGALSSTYFVLEFNQARWQGAAALRTYIAQKSPISQDIRIALLDYYKNSLKEALIDNPTILIDLGFSESELKSSEYSRFDYEKNEILAQLAINNHQYLAAYTYKVLSNKALDELNSKQKLNAESEIDLAIQNVELDHSVKGLKSENKYKSNQIILANIILVLTILLLVIIIYFWRKNNRIQKNQLETAQEMLAIKTESERLQLNENRLNEKLYALSKLIVEKSIHFANELKQSDVSKNPKIIEIRRGLEKLADIDNTFEKTKTELSTDALYKPIFDQYPDLNQLSVNGKKVLILSIQGYKPKEVAAMLDLSYDYVRNLKTKLNQIFAANNIEGFDALRKMV